MHQEIYNNYLELSKDN